MNTVMMAEIVGLYMFSSRQLFVFSDFAHQKEPVQGVRKKKNVSVVWVLPSF